MYTAELDVDMLRYYRRCEVWGFKNRRPELYGEISDKSYGLEHKNRIYGGVLS